MRHPMDWRRGGGDPSRRGCVHHRDRVPSRHSIQGDEVLNHRDFTGYDYVSVGKGGFVLISVKLTIGATRLAHDLI
jgi:hypothetical protein